MAPACVHLCSYCNRNTETIFKPSKRKNDGREENPTSFSNLGQSGFCYLLPLLNPATRAHEVYENQVGVNMLTAGDQFLSFIF